MLGALLTWHAYVEGLGEGRDTPSDEPKNLGGRMSNMPRVTQGLADMYEGLMC
jgi:hypothetical protein